MKPGVGRSQAFEHFIRPEATHDAQARISWQHTIQGEKFNVRIDRETGNHPRLSLDIGSVDAAKAFAYAQEVGQQSEKGEVVMKYSEILDSEGSHRHVFDKNNPHRDCPEFYYPSAMMSPLLSMNERMALVSSAILRQARGIGLFADDTFAYHCRGGALDKNKAHWHQFDGIARQYRSLVPRG